MYMAAANEITGREMFELPKLAEITRSIQV